jgi:hypothetical protein
MNLTGLSDSTDSSQVIVAQQFGPTVGPPVPLFHNNGNPCIPLLCSIVFQTVGTLGFHYSITMGYNNVTSGSIV